MDAGSTSHAPEDERRNLAYRRLVGVVFGLVILVAAVVVLRGIIRALDRLPSASVSVLEGPADTRALRACADDLEKLERRVRKAAGGVLSRPPPRGPGEAIDWQAVALPFEVERLNIVARCGLGRERGDPAAAALAAAAQEIEAMLRAYALLYGRHREDGAQHSRAALDALRRAAEALDNRDP